jgi:hypothetical protein
MRRLAGRSDSLWSGDAKHWRGEFHVMPGKIVLGRLKGRYVAEDMLPKIQKPKEFENFEKPISYLNNF